MSVTVKIPTQLRAATGGQSELEVEGGTSGEDIRFQQGLETSINDGDEVTILPAVAGGC